MMGSGWHVLLVEDDTDAAQVVEEALQLYQQDVDVVRVSDGSDALAVLESSHPTLVIMDLALPEMDGWQALDAMRQDPDMADIPVIALTAYHSERVAEDAREAGFDGYFTKPIDVFTFGRRLAEIVEN